MTQQLMLVEYPSTMRLSQSSTPGGRSSLARNEENDLKTHAVLFPADAEIDRIRAEGVQDGYADGSQVGLVVGAAVGVAVTYLALKAAPHVKNRFVEFKAKLGRKPEIAVETLPEEARPETGATCSGSRGPVATIE